MAKGKRGRIFLALLAAAVAVLALILIYLTVAFSSHFVGGSSCFGFGEFSCQPPQYASNGTISFPLSYSGASNTLLYNVQMGCTSNKTSENTPLPIASLENISIEMDSYIVQGTLSGNGITRALAPGRYEVTGIQCHSQMGTYLVPFNSNTGEATGYIWINYTLKNGSVNSVTNPWITKEIAQVTVHVG